MDSTKEASLYVHGHSCCEIRTTDFSIVCDPWLVGSAYWRSWWNYPPATQVHDLITEWSHKEKLYIYITHLHWDHFHAPTLRKLANALSNITFLIPYTPESRLKKDLQSIFSGKNEIVELLHAKKYNLTDQVEVLSYQSGLIFADSALAIKIFDCWVLNLNDSKLFSLCMRHLHSLIGRPKYVLRSHSSANDRCCLRSDLHEDLLLPFDKSKENYSKEFLASCFDHGAQYAIPFASNMACLHRETYQYDSVLNPAEDVEEYFLSVKELYQGMLLKTLYPGEGLDIFTASYVAVNTCFRSQLKRSARKQRIEEFLRTKQSVLSNQYQTESSAVLKKSSIIEYFSQIIKAAPLPLRLYLRNTIIIKTFEQQANVYFLLDFLARSVSAAACPHVSRNSVVIEIHPFVLNDVVSKKHWNSLGVSKRLKVYTRYNNKRHLIFTMLCNTVESGGWFPVRNIVTKRFASVWLVRWRELFDFLALLPRLVFGSLAHGRLH